MKRFWIIAFIAVLAFAFISCKNDPISNNGTGWPDNSILATYGLSGLPAPPGGTNISYIEGSIGDYPTLFLTFTGSSDHDLFYPDWYLNNGWTDLHREWFYPDDTYDFGNDYKKVNFIATYSRHDSNKCSIQPYILTE